MKRNLIYSIIVSSLVFVGCSKDFLDPVRNTSVLTAEDLSNFADVNPALVEGTLEGIASFMIQDFGVTGSRHYDFGHKGVDIWSDMVSGDMALSASAYGWYNNTSNLVCTVDFTREENRIIWDYLYRIVSLANSVIETATAPSFAHLLADLESQYQTDETLEIISRTQAYLASKLHRSTIGNANLVILHQARKDAFNVDGITIDGAPALINLDGTIELSQDQILSLIHI